MSKKNVATMEEIDMVSGGSTADMQCPPRAREISIEDLVKMINKGQNENLNVETTRTFVRK